LRMAITTKAVDVSGMLTPNLCPASLSNGFIFTKDILERVMWRRHVTCA
jgi:hypothetical protein